MLTQLEGSVKDAAGDSGIMMGVNYGFDKVRFVTPVKVDSKIRALRAGRRRAQEREHHPPDDQVHRRHRGRGQAGAVAEWITRLIFG